MESPGCTLSVCLCSTPLLYSFCSVHVFITISLMFILQWSHLWIPHHLEISFEMASGMVIVTSSWSLWFPCTVLPPVHPTVTSKLVPQRRPKSAGHFRICKQSNSSPFAWLLNSSLYNVMVNLPFQILLSLCYLSSKAPNFVATWISYPNWHAFSWVLL